MELVFVWLVMAAICAMVAASKGRSAIGFFFYGLAIWPIALVHALLSSKRGEAATKGAPVYVVPPPTPVAQAIGQSAPMKTCPSCAEEIRAAAARCRFCGHQFGSVVTVGKPPRPPLT